MKSSFMNTPLFSILIAQYNNGKYFEDCYKSIMAQTYTNWEAIIVDDCSTDDSVELMKKLIGDDTRFKIYSNDENKGCGFTKRRCVECATGEICGFLDPDDAIAKEALFEMISVHDDREISFAYSNFIFCNENLQPGFSPPKVQIDSFKEDFYNLHGEISHFVTFKMGHYLLTTGIDKYLLRAVDQDLYLKLYEVGKVFFVDKQLYYYRIHSGGISTMNNIQKAYYWKWVVVIDAAKRRNNNVEDLFLKHTSLFFQKEKTKRNTFRIFFRNFMARISRIK